MIKKFIADVDKTLDSSPIILSSDIQKHFGPNGLSVYLKGQIRFIDSSILEIAIFTTESTHTLKINKYRFHYMTDDRQMLFRYDNAPHHPDISSFPHHKHTSVNVVQSDIPSIRDVLNEISAMMVSKSY